MDKQLYETLKGLKAKVDDTLERFKGDEKFYMECLLQFLDNKNIILLRQAIEEKDSQEAERQIHTLKGIALNLGFLPLADVCMDMLIDFREGNTEDAMDQLEDVEECYHKWANAIKECCH